MVLGQGVGGRSRDAWPGDPGLGPGEVFYPLYLLEWAQSAADVAPHCPAGLSTARRGTDWQDSAWQGTAWDGTARDGWHGTARDGLARLGTAQHGSAGLGQAARRGSVRRGRPAPPRPGPPRSAALLSAAARDGAAAGLSGRAGAGMDGPSGGCPPAATAAPSRAKLPLGIVFSTALFCGEGAAAAVLCLSYGHSDDRFWLALTIFFVLCPSVLVQLTLIFVHRDLSRDRPLVLLMHLLQLGPIIR